MKLLPYSLVFAFVFALMVLPANQVNAQCCGANYAANEIGTHLGSLKDASTLGGIEFAGKTTHPSLLRGLHYRRYRDFSAFRLQFDYASYQIEPDECLDCLQIEGKAQGGELRVGWEWIAIFNRLEPYAGIDMVFTYGTYQGTEIGTNASGTYVNITDERKKSAMGLSPVVGVRLFPAYAFSISAETSLNAMVYQTSVTRQQIVPDLQNQNFIDSGGQLLFNPVSHLSLNVMF